MVVNQAILLAGGRGLRLGKFTYKVANKHLYPVFDQLVIEYPLATLKNLGIKNLSVIIGGEHFAGVVDFLGDGSEWGLHINYVHQKSPQGIADAINKCQPFITDEQFLVILGDNFFQKPLRYKSSAAQNAQIFLKQGDYLDFSQFGVASVSSQSRELVNLEEKPQKLNSSDLLEYYVITGAYLFTRKYFEYFKNLTLSERGEYEIIDILIQYLNDGNLDYSIYEGLWSDMGNLKSISSVRDFISKDH